MEPEQSFINRPVDDHATLLNEFGEMRWAGAGVGGQGEAGRQEGRGVEG